MDSTDIINQITLNCLISKTQLMKINNTKIKKNLDVERNEKIKKYKNHFIKLFQDLLDKNENSNSLDDDVKFSYVHFIDKLIIYLDKSENVDDLFIKDVMENKMEDEVNEVKNETNDNKIFNMMNECYDKRYHELIEDEEKEDENEIES